MLYEAMSLQIKWLITLVIAFDREKLSVTVQLLMQVWLACLM